MFHLVDESSHSEEEEAPFKRQKIEVDGKTTENKGPTGADPGLNTVVFEGSTILDEETVVPSNMVVASLSEIAVERKG